MLQKASEIQFQLSDMKEEIRRKRIAVEFSSCGRCKVEINFKHQVERDVSSESASIVEFGSCPLCQAKVNPRRFHVH